MQIFVHLRIFIKSVQSLVFNKHINNISGPIFVQPKFTRTNFCLCLVASIADPYTFVAAQTKVALTDLAAACRVP